MVLEIIGFAFVLTAIAGYFDLRTTEVPDEIPALLIAVSVFFWYINWAVTGNVFPLFVSIVGGSVLLSIGLLLYNTGQWGGADAWLLAGVAYALPLLNGSIFIIDYLFNFFLVTIVYMVLYAISLGIIHGKIFQLFCKDLKKSWLVVFSIPLAYALFVSIMAFFGFFNHSLIIILIVVVFMTLFWRYARVIEQHVFRKRIPASELKVGDVLLDSKWVGLTKDEIGHIRKRKKQVVIKEGVRFVPVFAITLLVTVLWGNVFFLII